MVKAIDFVVRDSAGGLVRGAVAGEGSNFVQMGLGEEISLNLARESVAGFVQQGSDLVITLIDGRQIVLAGYFNEAGEANQLYLSQNGEVIAVELADAGDGTMFASYGPAMVGTSSRPWTTCGSAIRTILPLQREPRTSRQEWRRSFRAWWALAVRALRLRALALSVRLSAAAAVVVAAAVVAVAAPGHARRR